MRILCLHGTALNGTVFESLTTKLRLLLPQTYSFEWVDGLHNVEPPTVVARSHPGPYLSYIERLEPEGIQSALVKLDGTLEQKGPFDGVMGFSEGAMLAATMLIRQQMGQSTSASSLRFGILISGMLPLVWNDNIGDDIQVVMQKYPVFENTVWQRPEKFAALSQDRIRALGLQEPLKSAQSGQELAPSLEAGASRPRCLHPKMQSMRLDRPTVHIWGSQDVLSAQSELLRELCDPDLVECYLHGGGHEIPTMRSDIEVIAELIENTVVQSQYT